MNAVNSLSRDLAEAKLEQANRWPEGIAPLIQAYLDLGALIDKLELGFNGWKPAGVHEFVMSQCHSALAQDHGRLRRDIEDYRESVIDDLTVGIDEYDAMLDCALSVDAAVRTATHLDQSVTS